MFVTGKGEAEDRPGGEGFVLLAAVGRVQVHLVQHQRPRPALVQTLQQQYSTVQYSTVQYSTVQYSTVQYSTVQYSIVQNTTDTVHLVHRRLGHVAQRRGHSGGLGLLQHGGFTQIRDNF